MKTLLFILLTCLATSAVAQTPRLVVPIGHKVEITSVAFSPDGKYVLTGGSVDHTAILWDLSGHQIKTYSASSYVESVAFSPAGPDDPAGGKFILLVSHDGITELRDLNDQVIQTFYGAVTAAAFAPDGKKVLTADLNNQAILWDIKGEKIQIFSGHKDQITSVAFAPDGKYVLTGSKDNTAKLWDLNGREIQTFYDPPRAQAGYEVEKVAFSPDSKFILTGSNDGKARLWNLKGEKIQSFEMLFPATTIAFSPDGQKVLTGCPGATVNLWDLAGKLLQTFSGHKEAVLDVAFSPDGQKVLTGSFDRTAKLWDLNGRTIQTFSGYSSSPVGRVAFIPDGKNILAGHLWGLAERGVRFISGAVSPDGQMALTDLGGGQAPKLWDLNNNSIIATYAGHTMGVSPTAFSPNNKLLVTGSLDSTAKLWDMSGREIRTFKGHTDRVVTVAFSPDSKRVLTGSWDKTAKLWDINGNLLQTFANDDGIAALSPDGRLVLTSNSGEAKLWDLNGNVIQTFSNPQGAYFTSLAFSPDGQLVLTGSMDVAARLWNLNGHIVQTFSGHTGFVDDMALSADGQKVLTGSRDHTAKLWDVKSGKELATLFLLDKIGWVVTTPSGLFDASSGAMERIYFVQGLEVIGLEQLKGRYWEPGLLSKIMGFSKSELRNVSAFGTLPLYPEIKASITSDRLHVDLKARSGGMGRLSLSVNGKEKMPDANPGKKTGLDIDLKQFALDLLPEGNTITLRSYIAGDGWLKSQDYNLPYVPGAVAQGKGQGGANPEPKPAGSGPRPHLYAILVGTSKYSSSELALTFPDGDARAMEQALKAVSTAWLGAERVHVRRLSTDATSPADMADKVNIAAAFRDAATQAKSTDILVVFFSGHGKTYTANGKSNFYYLTKDMRSMEELGDTGVRERFSISDDELGQWLIDNHSQRQVLIFDACNSGTAVQNFSGTGARELNSSQIRANDLLKDRTGTFILAGSAADKVSFEASKYGQGLLTRSLLEGMNGLALDEDRVDVTKLFEYACRKVPELAADVNRVQKPVPFFPKGGSFPIGIKDASVRINLPPGKPVMIRNYFQDNRFGDQLGLTKAMEQYFRDLTVKPAEAPVSYVPVDEYNDQAYSIRGRYTVDGETVQAEGSLFKGGEPVPGADFKVRGAKSDVPGLAKAVVDAVWGKVK